MLPRNPIARDTAELPSSSSPSSSAKTRPSSRKHKPSKENDPPSDHNIIVPYSLSHVKSKSLLPPRPPSSNPLKRKLALDTIAAENSLPATTDSGLGNCVEIGIPMLLLVVGLSQYLKHVRPFRDIPIFERFPVLSTGAYKAASRLAIATPPPAYMLSRGIGWQGIGILLDGLYGTGTGSTVSVENVGLLGLTRVGSRRVVQISAGFMIFFATLGKFGAVFASIPFPIFAALYCVLFGLVGMFLAFQVNFIANVSLCTDYCKIYITNNVFHCSSGAVGISFLQFTNMNSMRNLIIIGLTLFLGISVPQFFDQYWTNSRHGPVHTNALWFNAFLNTIFSSPPTVGLIVAVILDNTLEVEKSKKDRGMPWWVKFRTFRGDNKNEEFYTLPFNLNKFFPPT
ncbi:N-terminal acetyltransferase [Lathyrus oleraceus]|uniref:N-terminal acetyltransferase n=1 Tax=Pisum sativum TaxID=3888 RepID=A0A9D5AKU2_PEA|nr:N-terminal acetyltransferase [Pisum sativum]